MSEDNADISQEVDSAEDGDLGEVRAGLAAPDESSVDGNVDIVVLLPVSSVPG